MGFLKMLAISLIAIGWVKESSDGPGACVEGVTACDARDDMVDILEICISLKMLDDEHLTNV